MSKISRPDDIMYCTISVHPELPVSIVVMLCVHSVASIH